MSNKLRTQSNKLKVPPTTPARPSPYDPPQHKPKPSKQSSEERFSMAPLKQSLPREKKQPTNKSVSTCRGIYGGFH